MTAWAVFRMDDTGHGLRRGALLGTILGPEDRARRCALGMYGPPVELAPAEGISYNTLDEQRRP